MSKMAKLDQIGKHETTAVLRARIYELIAQRDALASLVTAFLCDAETMNEPYRNEALCEHARAALDMIRSPAPAP